MQLYDLVLSKLDVIASNFKYPIYLWGIPILFLILLIVITRNFVRFSMDEETARKLRKLRVITFILRWLCVSMLCIALATPFTTLSLESEGNPHALILVDESASMQAYDTSFVPYLTTEIGKQLPTTVKSFGSETESPIGDAALGNPEHLLIISDGNVNTGVDLLDVAQVAKANNLSINIIDLSPVKQDAGVVIDAPASVPLGFPAEITVEVTSTDATPVPLRVTIDGKELYNQATLGPITLKPTLGEGYHRVEAVITSPDSVAQNNAHYRVIETLPRPKILVLTKAEGPLENALKGLFDTTVLSAPPADLSGFSAIVLNDLPASRVPRADDIADFLRDEEGGKYGNGLVVIGGFNSYDRGSYQNTQLESLLPVKVGKPKRTLGESNLVFVIQVSGSTGGTRTIMNPDGTRTEVTDNEPTIDVIKAQAVAAINSLNLKNNVGVIAFGVSTTGQSHDSAEETLQASVVKIADIGPLYSQKQELVDKIPRIQGGGTTAPDIALRAAVDMLKDRSGDKTIILLTNGRFSAGLGAGDDVPAKVNTLSVVQNAYKRYGIKTQTIGVGSRDEAVFAKKVDESFLTNVAIAGESTYDRATNLASLIVKYGDPNEKGFGETFNLVLLSLTHFITKDVELTATLNGYNEVAPKDGARILVTTDSGAPALTTWNYFNGRVAAVTVFTASGLGPLLEGKNSDLIRNTVLWAVGDPRRKEEVSVTVDPAIVGHRTEATFVSKSPITGNCEDTAVQFERSSGDTYVFSFMPKEPGFGTVCGIPYAVNAESEWWRVGENQRLKDAAHVSGGEVFTFDQVKEIVERIKTVSTRVTVEKTELRNPFVGIAIVLFLLEIFIRRLSKQAKL